MIDSLQQDLRYALRTLRASPAFTLVAVLSLALGIGANSAIFSLLDAVMLKYLPVQHPEELLRHDAAQRHLLDVTHHRAQWSEGHCYILVQQRVAAVLRDHGNANPPGPGLRSARHFYFVQSG